MMSQISVDLLGVVVFSTKSIQSHSGRSHGDGRGYVLYSHYVTSIYVMGFNSNEMARSAIT